MPGPSRWRSFGPKLSALAARRLRKLGVELHMGSVVTHVVPGGLKVRDRDGDERGYDARHRAVDRGRRGAAVGRCGSQGDRRASRTGRAGSWSART